MYGLINCAIQDMVVRTRPEAWELLRTRAGVPADGFRLMESYDDALTYRLVGAASEMMGVTLDEVLRAFGRHWISYVEESGFGSLLDLGDTLEEQLRQLDTLHGRLAAAYPGMVEPSFNCTTDPDGTLRVTYRSTRPGLAPMVHGMLEALCARFGEGIVVEFVHHERASATFRITR